MLKEFRVKNFKSINQEQIFSMEACPQKEVSEYPGHVLNINGNRLLKVSSFYGPNGGGKTTLFVAIVNMIHVANIISIIITYYSSKLFINIMKKGKLIYFSIYCFIIGILTFIFIK